MYLMADNNLEGVLRDDLLETIRSQAIRQPELTTWVYFDGRNDGINDPLPEVWIKDGSQLITSKEEGSRYLTFSHTLGKMIVDTTLQGEQDSDSPETVTNFVKHALTDCVARGTKEYFILFSDHGSGYGGFGGDDNKMRRLGQKNNEILSALENALASVPGAPDVFDIIGFDACLMMAFGALDEFGTRITKYMLASEAVEPLHGWAFEPLSNVDSALDLAKDIHENYLTQTQNTDHDTPKTLAIVDTSKFEVFRDSLEYLSAELKSLLDANNDPTIYAAVVRARDQALTFFHGFDLAAVDIGSFLSELSDLCGPAEGSELESLLLSTTSAYQDMFVVQGVGPGTAAGTGMHVYFPYRWDYLWAPFYYNDILFENPDYATLSAPNWLGFLQSYYNAEFPSDGESAVCSRIGETPTVPAPPPPSPSAEPTPSFRTPKPTSLDLFLPTSPPDLFLPTSPPTQPLEFLALFFNEAISREDGTIVVEATISLAADEVAARYGLKVLLPSEARRQLEARGSPLVSPQNNQHGQLTGRPGVRRVQETEFFLYGGKMASTYDGPLFTAVWDESFYVIGEDGQEFLLDVESLGSSARRAQVMYFPPGVITEDANLSGITVEEAESLGGSLGSLSFVESDNQDVGFSLFSSVNGGAVSGIPPTEGGNFVPILHVGGAPYELVLGGLENSILVWRQGHGIKISKVNAAQYAGRISFGSSADVVVALSAVGNGIVQERVFATSQVDSSEPL